MREVVFAGAIAVHQASAHRLSRAALQRLPKALKMSQAVVSLAIMPFLPAVHSEPNLASVSGLRCSLKRWRPVSVVGKAGYVSVGGSTLA